MGENLKTGPNMPRSYVTVIGMFLFSFPPNAARVRQLAFAAFIMLLIYLTVKAL